MIPPDQLAEAERALGLRKTCYAHWIATGRLTPGQARYRQRHGWPVVTTLRLLDDDARQLELFAHHEEG